MGQRQIKDKLRTELSILESGEYYLEEKDIVYFLVETRKMIDHENKAYVFPAIKFYADWALHIQKDHVPEFVQEMMGNSDDKLNEFVNMQYLRREISNFLKSHELSLILVNEKNWKVFWRKLIDILSEQPIILKRGVLSRFKFCASEIEETITFEYEM